MIFKEKNSVQNEKLKYDFLNLKGKREYNEDRVLVFLSQKI